MRSERANILVKVATSKFFDGSKWNKHPIKMKKEKPGQLESSHSNQHVLTVDIWRTNHLD
jgi:hypothetical protein